MAAERVEIDNGNMKIGTADKGIVFYGGVERIIGISAYGMEFQTSSSTKMTLTNNGYVGIGLWPWYQFQLSTDLAGKLSTNTWSITSDARLKANIQPYTRGLKEILQINPVTYNYNGKGGIGHNKVKSKDPITGTDVETEVMDTQLLAKTNVGVLAQDIQVVVPETVTSHRGKINENDADETDILDFNSHSLTFILINAVKELNAKIDSLNDLNSKIDSLNQQIADLKAKIK
jgi:polyhydroxyalkanoate synthesis regulator phasin